MRLVTMTAVETIARAFHNTYEAQADFYGWETQEATRTAWDDLPTANKALMLSVVDTLITTAVIVPGRHAMTNPIGPQDDGSR